LGENAMAYVMQDPLRVREGGELVVEAGVVIKGWAKEDKEGHLIVEAGGLLATKGTDSKRVVFTSVHDDSVLGGTEKATTTPAAGDWQGILVEEGSSIALEGATIRYAGGDETRGLSERGGLVLQAAATSTIENVIFENNKQNGLTALDAAPIFLKQVTFSNQSEEFTNHATGLRLQSMNASGENLLFDGNDFDVELVSGATFVCETCSEDLNTIPEDLFVPEEDEEKL